MMQRLRLNKNPVQRNLRRFILEESCLFTCFVMVPLAVDSVARHSQHITHQSFECAFTYSTTATCSCGRLTRPPERQVDRILHWNHVAHDGHQRKVSCGPKTADGPRVTHTTTATCAYLHVVLVRYSSSMLLTQVRDTSSVAEMFKSTKCRVFLAIFWYIIRLTLSMEWSSGNQISR